MIQSIAITLLIAAAVSIVVGMFMMITDKTYDSDAPPLFTFGGMAAALLACAIGGIDASATESAHRQKLMQQCIDDGRKEYECSNLLRKPESTVVPMPIIIGR